MNEDKIKTTLKIKSLCKEYKIKEPDFSSYASVKKVCDRINHTCPFCHHYPYGGDICPCEISPWGKDWKNEQDDISYPALDKYLSETIPRIESRLAKLEKHIEEVRQHTDVNYGMNKNTDKNLDHCFDEIGLLEKRLDRRISKLESHKQTYEDHTEIFSRMAQIEEELHDITLELISTKTPKEKNK